MTPRRVVMVAMPCAEVMEIGGTLDVFFAANLLLEEAGRVRSRVRHRSCLARHDNPELAGPQHPRRALVS
jgi:hypothetical protein